MFSIVQDDTLRKMATTPAQGRLFWTGGRIEEANKHLRLFPNDVCMVRHNNSIVLLGGPIPKGKLLDVTRHDFSDTADSFDVGEMTSLVDQWFKKDFDKEVNVDILESGEMIHGLSHNSKLISLSRKTPALLDMATTETGDSIGQYSNTGGTLGHSGDCHSTIGGVQCLHHECPIKALRKLYFLAGYSNRPLKAWRDSRVFWILYDPDQEKCWLVPHDLSHQAVGDEVSATMPLVSRQDPDSNSTSVIHLSEPVQGSLNSASPLNPRNDQKHREYMRRCMVAANNIDWTQSSKNQKIGNDNLTQNAAPFPLKTNTQEEISMPLISIPIDRSIAIFDNCDDTLFKKYPQICMGKRSISLSPMHGPLKVLSSGCCANSRVVVIDAESTSESSEINSLSRQLSGVIFVKAKCPDVYKLHQIRWNVARASLTPVLALTPDGCKHLCGPMPTIYQNEEYPTPVAGSYISNEEVEKLIEFALSSEGDKYFGPLYQPIPSFEKAKQVVEKFISDMETKNFSPINGKEPDLKDLEDSFGDNHFRQLMEVVNIISVSTSTAVERNKLAIQLVKFLKKISKRTADNEVAASLPITSHSSELEVLNNWNGENVEWALENKKILEDTLTNVKIFKQEGVEIDLVLQIKLDEAIKKRKSELITKIRRSKVAIINGWKKTFNAVFHPALESLMLSIGDNPRYRKYFSEIKNPNMSGVITCASQSTNKQTIANNPENVMKLFHKLGATGFVSFTINFLHTWKSKVINEICLLDQPGEGFNDPETYVPVNHFLEDGPADPVAAYETDIRHQFVLPTFVRLPKMINDDSDDEDDMDMLQQMPVTPVDDDLAKYVLMRAEFMLRDPEQGTRHPMWQYVDWLFHQIKIIHQVNEKQAAPLAMRALGFSISTLMKAKPNPDKVTLEIVASIIQAICFMSARGDVPHACIDTFFSMGSTYVPLTKDMERNPWQIEIINILSHAVDYLSPMLSEEEYKQIRANFQRAAANTVKRQIVNKLLENVQEERKRHMKSQEEYVAQVNNEFYPAYREVIEIIAMLISVDPKTFELTDEICHRIEVLYNTVVIEWAKSMRRCRVGPVRRLVEVLKTFSEQGGEAMKYLVSQKKYLENLYDQVYHIKYESCDHALIEEVCRIIKAKTRNPEHENHDRWLSRVDQAINDISNYNERMAGFAHGNQYKHLPTKLMLKMLCSLKVNPVSKNAVTFNDVKSLLAHVNIEVRKPSDLNIQSNNGDKKAVFDQLRGAWWMCPDIEVKTMAVKEESGSIPTVALIPMSLPNANLSNSSNIIAILGDTYHKFKLARLYSGKLQPMRNFILENYKFHPEWFEETIRAAGFPQYFDSKLVEDNELKAIYAVVQRLVVELVQDESDRGDKAREKVYGDIVAPRITDQFKSDMGDGNLALKKE